MKRTLLIACSALAISATAAVAADPMAPSYYDWNGFYVGLNAGYGFGGIAKQRNVARFAKNHELRHKYTAVFPCCHDVSVALIGR